MGEEDHVVTSKQTEPEVCPPSTPSLIASSWLDCGALPSQRNPTQLLPKGPTFRHHNRIRPLPKNINYHHESINCEHRMLGLKHLPEFWEPSPIQHKTSIHFVNKCPFYSVFSARFVCVFFCLFICFLLFGVFFFYIFVPFVSKFAT